jgi:Mg-chelatase subunit ChlD
MPNPSVNPTGLGSIVYTAINSRSIVADLSLDVLTTNPFPQFHLRYPAAATDVEITLFKGATPLPLPVDDGGSFSDSATFAQRRVTGGVSLAGAELVLDGEIRALSMAANNEVWSIRATSSTPTTWQFSQDDNTAGDPTITRIMSDPVATFTLAAPSLSSNTVREKDTVTLAAAAATGTSAAPTVIGNPVPPARYSWSKAGLIAVPAFPACGGSTQMVFVAPGVYGSKTLTLGLDVWFEGGCPGPVGFLHTTAPGKTITVKPRPQHLALVLDRSGSMAADTRWDNAVTAAQILTHLFVAMRLSVENADRIALLVFEDDGCSWHTGPSPLIGPVLGLESVAGAAAAITGVKFGQPGSCTPIGDGLIVAMDQLATLGVADDPRFTIVLLTDGFENAGSVVVDPNTPVPMGITKFSQARNTGLARQNVNTRLSLYTIGLGSTVQEDVLDALAAQSQGVYRHVIDVSQVGDALAQMVSLSQQAQRLIPAPAAGTSRLVAVDPGVSRLAISVTWTDPTDTIALRMRETSGGGGFTPVAAATTQCPTNGFVTVDLTAMFGGDETAVPATEWEITHQDSASSPIAIPDNDLLIFVDLLVQADFSFDQPSYSTGDPIVITARLRAGDDPITDARVAVELARPGESLGTFLATNGHEYRPDPIGGPDPALGKQLMLQTLLRRADRPDGLELLTPSSIFEDGSNELFDDGNHFDGSSGDGNFANRYLDTDLEGTYTWRFAVTGRLPDGSDFSRVVTISKWVGIGIDPRATEIMTEQLDALHEGIRYAITVVPQDGDGQLLGPFRPADVIFRSSDCPFEVTDPEKLPRVPDGVVYPLKGGGTIISRYHGSYTRIIECPKGVATTVTITVRGVDLPPLELPQ